MRYRPGEGCSEIDAKDVGIEPELVASAVSPPMAAPAQSAPGPSSIPA